MKAPEFHVERIRNHLEDFESLRYMELIKIDFFYSKEDTLGKVNPPVPKEDYTKWDKLYVKDFWSGRDKYVWLRNSVEIPPHKGEKVVAIFDFGRTDDGNTSGFEALLYVNGQIYQGVDLNHKEVIIDTSKTGNKLDLAFRLWSGLEGGGEEEIQYHQIKEAALYTLHKSSDGLFYLGNAVLDTIERLSENDFYKHELESIMIKTMQKIDFTNLRSEEFYASVDTAYDYLEKSLAEYEKTSPVEVHCVGHTHIDLAWLWRIKHTREKAARSFATVFRLMEEYDEYKFLQSQAQIYDYLKKDFPELYEKIKEKVKEKKWEPSGAMWVEADCNISSGEALVRQVLLGKQFFQEEFGFENTFLWLPDVFGYSWALPQILKKSGVDTFITTKISWNEVNRMPDDTFFWRGIDGTEILTHFVTTPAEHDGDPYYTYNGETDVEKVMGVWNNYRNKDINKSVLISYGHGDGGGGVDRKMLENIRAVAKIPALPTIKTNFVTDYLKQLHETVAKCEEHNPVPVWDGELYLEFHRGTYTSQGHNKKMNRKLELKYRLAEILSVVKSVDRKDFSNYDYEKLLEGWKIILRNQFHDILPGSSIREVYEDSKVEYEQADKKADEVIKKIVSTKTTESKELNIYNTQAWTRKGYAKVEGSKKDSHLVDENGKVVPTQQYLDNTYFYVEEANPFEMNKYIWRSGAKDFKSAFTYKTNFVESVYYKISWDENGHITSIYDKLAKREVLSGKANVLTIYEDKPRSFDAWELEATIDLKKENVSNLIDTELMSNGECLVAVRFIYQYNKSLITQDLVLYNKTRRIDFVTNVKWYERNKVLKTVFPVNVRSVKARFDTQFGSVERPTHRNTSWDRAKFEVPCHQWVDLSETGFGVGLLNESKYGCDIKDNVMRLTLLKSAIYPDPKADEGVHDFTYSILPHSEIWYKSEVIKEAWDLNNPILVFDGKDELSRLLEVENEGVTIDCIKRSEDGEDIIIRLHEHRGGRCDLDMKLGFEHSGWAICDNMEKVISKVNHSDTVSYELKPFELLTIRVSK